MKCFTTVAILLMLTVLSACGVTTAPLQQNSHSVPHGYVQCENSEPRVCTAQYDPVCALFDTGKRCIKAPCDGVTVKKTVSNGCAACSTAKVIGYTPGACAAEE